MRRGFNVLLLLSVILLILPTSSAFAQKYYFQMEVLVADVYWESDGTVRIEYELVFYNDPSADPMEFIDIGVPTSSYSRSAISATIDGKPITNIESSPFVSPGFVLGLGSNAIPPGSRGTVRVSIPGVRDALFFGDEEGYASALFSPVWFDSEFVYGNMDLTVRYHLPPGILPEEPRWHESPSGWPSDAPATGLDNEGRVVYEWHNPVANGSTPYVFGASFPSTFVPVEVIQTEPTVAPPRIDDDLIFGFLCVGGFAIVTVLFIIVGLTSVNRRKLDYLPPKISIEGHGIKRGLTAVEAAILLETDLDRVLTMMLFSTIKKNAIKVVEEEPLKIEKLTPEVEGLRPYETEFIKAMVETDKKVRSKGLQDVAISLVQSVQKKMKGFSLKETKTYYQSIVKQAWNQVETAETPEVRSEKFAESIEWSMLDRDFDGRTKRVFRTGPVYVPIWWGHYRPSTVASAGGRAAPSTPTSVSVTHSRGGISLPTLPGSEFANSVVQGVQNTAGNIVSNVTSFTNRVTKTTNPPPPPSSRGGGGRSFGGGSGCACACACACAGCACACAGGGR
jgi:hypothetical protein